MKNETVINQKVAKTILREYYDNLSAEDRRRFIRTVQERTGVSHTTVYRWLDNAVKIGRADASIIADMVHMPLINLFPHLSTEFNSQTAS